MVDRRDALIIRVTAAWTVLIWAVFLRNLIGDDEHSTGFKVVHSLLAVVSLTLAVASWGVVARSRRRASDRASSRS